MEPNETSVDETTNTENVLTIDSVCGNLENAAKKSTVIAVVAAVVIIAARAIINGSK